MIQNVLKDSKRFKMIPKDSKKIAKDSKRIQNSKMQGNTIFDSTNKTRFNSKKSKVEKMWTKDFWELLSQITSGSFVDDLKRSRDPNLQLGPL